MRFGSPRSSIRALFGGKLGGASFPALRAGRGTARLERDPSPVPLACDRVLGL
jgi:hypothetical protein